MANQLKIKRLSMMNISLEYANSSSKFLHLSNVFICMSDFVNNNNPDDDLALWFEGNVVSEFSPCNGLLHIYQRAFERWNNAIWNPMTNEFFLLPESEHDMFRFGFGFSPKTKQYKLFRAIRDEENPICRLEVWRFGISDQWELLCSQPFGIHYHGTYFNGVVYWMGKNATNHEFVVYALEVETEIFETIAILDVGRYYAADGYFQPLNDTICLIINLSDEPIGKLQLWTMRAKHLWIKEFVVDLPRDERLYDKFYVMKVFDGEQMLYFLLDSGNDLFYIDRSGKKIKIQTVFDPNETKIKSTFLIESFRFDSLSKILAGKD